MSHNDANFPKKNEIGSLTKPTFDPWDTFSTTAIFRSRESISRDIDRPDHHDFSSEVNLFQEIAKILANWL